MENCIEGAILITNAYREKYEGSNSLSILLSRSSSPNVEIRVLSEDTPTSPSKFSTEVPSII